MNPRGFLDDVTHFCVSGWAADLDDVAATLRLGVFINGQGVATIQADQHRTGLEQVVAGATGRYAFKFYFPVALSPFREYEITLRCPGTDFCLATTLPAAAPIGLPRADDTHRPHGPILLTSGGRSGSTAVMEVLRRHPQIVVAGEPPYEIEMSCYYAYALRALVAAADHEHSLRPDRVTDVRRRFGIGFNPHFVPAAFGGREGLERFLSHNAPGRLGNAFRELILDYYQTVARAQTKASPIYFAEKTLPEPDSRVGVRYLFGHTREIVLVRDPRDVICSFMKHGGVPFAAALNGAMSSSRRFLQMKEEGGEHQHWLRYEDFVLRQEETLAALYRFLGLPPEAYDEAGMGQLFQSHGTSRTPADSIGRWGRELTEAQLAECRRLEQFLREFSYDVA